MTVREYQQLVAELADAERRRDLDLAAAEQSYLDASAAVSAELAEAAEAERSAARRVRAATVAIAEADREAVRLWDELRGTLGWRGRRLGPVPEPASTVETGAAAVLRRTAERVATAQQSRVRRPLPRRVLPLLPLLGGAAAALVACVAAGLLVLGFTVTTVLGQVAFFLAPFTGLPVAARWVSRRYHAGLDTGGIGLTIIGGMLACSLVVLTLR